MERGEEGGKADRAGKFLSGSFVHSFTSSPAPPFFIPFAIPLRLAILAAAKIFLSSNLSSLTVVIRAFVAVFFASCAFLASRGKGKGRGKGRDVGWERREAQERAPALFASFAFAGFWVQGCHSVLFGPFICHKHRTVRKKSCGSFRVLGFYEETIIFSF